MREAPTSVKPDGLAESGRFIWPPQPPVEIEGKTRDEERTSAVEADAATQRPLRGWLRDVEEFWLAPTARPLPERMEAADWSRDALDDYCNRCGLTVGPHEADEFGCSACLGRRLAWDRFVRLGEYSGALADWIQDVKFTAWRSLGHSLGAELGRALREAGVLRTAASRRGLIVTPTPTAPSRRVARGIDHTLVIARGVSAELGVRPRRLLRARRRPSQRSIPASERTRNVSAAFSRQRRLFRPVAPLEGATLIVVDDVRTSGATMAAAIRALSRGRWAGRGRPAEVWAATLAVAGRKP